MTCSPENLIRHSDNRAVFVGLAPLVSRSGGYGMKLANKVAIVTDGGSGFGAGIVQKFDGEGAGVVVMDSDEASAPGVATKHGAATIAVAGDVTPAQDWNTARARAINAWGNLHIVVNNAGIGQVPNPTESMSYELFERMAAVNMRSIYLSAQVCIPHFKAQRHGTILNVASTGGVSPRPLWHQSQSNQPGSGRNTATVELHRW